MPQFVCIDCRVLFEHSYRFKQMCKKAETLLRQVPLTGEWPEEEIAKPRLPTNFMAKPPVVEMLDDIELTSNSFHDYDDDNDDYQELTTSSPPPPSAPLKVLPINIPQKVGNTTIRTYNKKPKEEFSYNSQNETLTRKIINNTISNVSSPEPTGMPMKILNANPAKSPEPPVPKRCKKEQPLEEDDDATTIFLNKVENDEELSIEDLQRLIQSNPIDDVTHKIAEKPINKKPKLLNKSSIRILNKEADRVFEPQFSKPEVKRDKDGNVAVVTEIIDPSEFNLENKDIKDAEPVETNVFPCPHCERSFPLRQLRDIHIVNHTRERSNPCAHCSKSFFSKYDLQKHMLTHSNDKPFKCTICQKAFTRATLLHRHEKTHTDIPKFICLYCEKPFISHEEMEKHAERHNKHRPFKCSVCDKQFAFKQGLERHFVVHSNDQPFPCHYCEQSFPTSSKLARHLTAHAGRRPYPCKFCSKSFLLSHHLTRHLRSHKSSACSYECSSCTAVFNAREPLIRHTAEHTKQTLICVLCCEELTGENQVDEHIEAHVAGEAFACEFCDMMFMSADRLQNHTDNDHADDLVAYIEDDKKQLENKEPTPTVEENIATKNNANTPRVYTKRKKEFKIEPEEQKDAAGQEAKEAQPQDDEDELFQSIKEFLLTDPMDVKKEAAAQEQNKLDNSLEFLEEDEEQVVLSPPAKRKRVSTGKQTSIQESPPKTVAKEKTSPLTRRKSAAAAAAAAVAASVSKTSNTIDAKKVKTSPKNMDMAKTRSSTETHSPKKDIKLEKEKIENVLKTLPKSVSVRRNKVSGTNEATNANKQQESTKTVSNMAKVTKTNNKSKNANRSVAVKKKKIINKVEEMQEDDDGWTTQDSDDEIVLKSIATNNKASDTKQVENSKESDDVTKIALSKMDAATMAKQGRLRIKDGKIVLSRDGESYKK